MEALKSVCLSASRGIAALFLSSSVSEKHQHAPYPLEGPVVSPLGRGGSVVFSSLHLNMLQRVSVCGTTIDTKSETTHQALSNRCTWVVHRDAVPSRFLSFISVFSQVQLIELNYTFMK